MAKTLTKPIIRPTHEEIQQRAYAIFEERGRPHGQDMEHWFEAETQLMAEKLHELEEVPTLAIPSASPRQQQPIRRA